MQDIVLSDQERADLQKLHRQMSHKRQADRIKIILLLDKGYSQKEVAEILLLDEDTITKWKKSFLNRQAGKDWFSDNYEGSVGKLSFVQLSRLRQYLNAFTVSNKGELLDFIQNAFGVSYSASGLQRLLKRIRFSFKQLHRLPGGVNLTKQAEFLRQFEKLIAHPSPEEEIIFLDAVHFLHNSSCDKIWSEIGQIRWIQSNTGRQSMHLNGAYNPHSQELFIQEFKKIDAQSTLDIFQTISAHYAAQKKVYVFADNSRTNKCKLIQAYLARQTKIQLIYLPPYSPNLNLIERLWKFIRQKVLKTKFFPDFTLFKKAIMSFVDNLEPYKKELARLINGKFQLFEKLDSTN